MQEEFKRVIQGLQKADAEGIATPANWHPGDDVIMPAPGFYALTKERVESQDAETYCLD